AKAMIDLGITNTQVIEFAPRLMPRQIDDAGSALLQNQLEDLGLTIRTGTNTNNILGENNITGMQFADGSSIETDMLVISAGIKPRDELARSAGLETGPRGGIVVNNYMQTTDPSIFAIGECALHQGMIYGLVAPGYEMAAIAIQQIFALESGNGFTGFDMSTKLKLIGIDVASFGDPFASGPDTRQLVYNNAFGQVYKRINISADGQYLLGGILVGDASQYNMLLQTFKNRIPLPSNPEDVLLGSRNGEGVGGAGVDALPAEALICSCEAVTKGAICEAVSQKGCETADGVKACTKAGSGCGGCIPMIKDLVNHTLKSEGKYIRNVLCEHFQYSRQELLDLVKVKELKTYNSVLDELGEGDGCEVCKPAVASILASLWNEMILEKGNDVVQDSNDRFLANIQKGGTYSVVPRIPGGEITPDKLIAIGQVAKKYNLYTKITGGQRIDLFG
ncbi:MAG TPA: FAD-dependent oxidoreductase, partial [Anaerolineae bacterium]|nr:FAD-dependent oxidoreductase [Anaerolineae bacterium]